MGTNNVNGNAGNDVIGVSTDNPLAATKCAAAPATCIFRSKGDTLIGGRGNDYTAGGSGDDTIFTGPFGGAPATDPDGVGTSDDGSVNIVDTGTGNDTVYGSTGEDRVPGLLKPTSTTRSVAAGKDILVGSFGTDRVFSGPGDDYVIAEPSTVETKPTRRPTTASVRHTASRARHCRREPAERRWWAGTGRDHIIGGDGGADIDGDSYNATIRCGPGDGCMTRSLKPEQPDGADKIIGGAGVDNVRAGRRRLRRREGQQRPPAAKRATTPDAGTGDDQVWGGRKRHDPGR
jgi:Ca2+-binding RTX toxin-like protein